jgi:hypothetical protein
MEFIARTVVHPNGRLAKQAAEDQLKQHPQFVPGTVIVAMNQDKGTWVAELHEPKTAAPNPFASDDAESPVDSPEPSSDSAPSDEGDDKPKDDEKGEDKGDDKKDKGKGGIEQQLLDLVQQIATAVGVAPTPDLLPDGAEDLGPEGPPPSAGPHPHGPEGGPPHDETTSVPGSPDTKQIIHRKAPPGAVPVGAPAFASTKQAAPKVATFDVEEPTDMPLHVAKQEIESIYGPHGYAVVKMAEGQDESGRRTVRARVSAHAGA